jgi:uncharacterized membrane protein YphA (DoxX/SURF4 family)
MNHLFNLELADFVFRCITGILFLFQGYEKVFKIKAGEIVTAFQTDRVKKFIPGSFLKITVLLSAYIELLGGLMLLIGFQRDIALYLLSTQMIFVAVAFSLIRPMWDMQYFFPRLVFIIALLIFPPEWDRFSIDHLLK